MLASRRGFLCFAAVGCLCAAAPAATETVGEFAVTLNPGGDSSVTWRGRPIVRSERAMVAATADWHSILPGPQADIGLTWVSVPGGRQAQITQTALDAGQQRKVITVTADYVDYQLEVDLKPGIDGGHQSQWFVLLEATEGGRYAALTPSGPRDGELHSAPLRQLVPEFRELTFPTAAGPITLDAFDSDAGWHLDDYTQFWAKAYVGYNSLDLKAKQGCRRRVGFRLYPAGPRPQPHYTPVSIAAACNRGFADEVAGDRQGGWIDDGPNDLRKLPVGTQTLRGIPFTIVDPAANGGKSCVVLRGQAWQGYAPRDWLPASASVPLGATAATLYFLQTCAWPAPEGTIVARYRLVYDDGTNVELPQRSGADLRDWFNAEDGDHCPVAWSGVGTGGALYGVHLNWWRNPFPEKRITRLDLGSESTSAVPILLAVTLSDQPPRFSGAAVDASLEQTDTSGWMNATFPWCDAEPSVATDVSFLLDAPAGRHGFVTVKDGHLVFADGKRAKFWGINLDRVPCFPHPDNAARLAAHLAKYGTNLVRLHCLDSFQPNGPNVFDPKAGDSAHLGPNMDRFDRFMAELKRRGIYVMIDLWGYRRFTAADQVPEVEAWNAATVQSVQGGPFFDARLQQIERDYATLLLGHVNPYTGLALKDDPMLALLQLYNEVTLFQPWTWQGLPPSYLAEAKAQWNAWLKARYPNQAALAKAWLKPDGSAGLRLDEDPAAGTVALFTEFSRIGQAKGSAEEQLGPARVSDGLRFYTEVELQHGRMMRDHLRKMGVRCPIGSTGDIGATAPSARAAAQLDWIDQHTYWHHPSYPKNRTRLRSLSQLEIAPFTPPGTDAETNCAMNNVMRTAAVKTLGVPLVNCEWNIPWPNESRHDGPIFMAAYASLQDWDGLLMYAWTPFKGLAEVAGQEPSDPLCEKWQSDTDPARAATWQTAAALFLRGDVQPAKHRVVVAHGADDPYAPAAAPQTWAQPHGPRYAPWRFLPFLSRVESTWDGATAPADLRLRPNLAGDGSYRLEQPGRPARTVAPPADPNADPAWLFKAARETGLWPAETVRDGELRSDTGQLAWRYVDATFTLDTPRSQAAAGRLAGRELRLSGLTLQATTPACSIAVVALDDRPLATSRKVLIGAGARARNTGQTMRAAAPYLTVIDAGHLPVLAEPVAARLELRRAAGAPRLRAWALGTDGRRGPEVPVTVVAGGLSLTLGPPAPALYYELAER